MLQSADVPILTEMAQQIRMLSARQWGDMGVINLVGRSTALLESQQRLERLAKADSTVLITGESGVGKEVFSRALFLLSKRIGKPFLTINCAHYQDDNLILSDLFGHKKGSFTGADRDHIGLFEAAEGGVLFMDEVGELSLKAQAMVLRALSEGEIKPLGANQSKRVNVRVIAATNRPLEEMVPQKSFREDLYYRLRYLRLRIPSLRERGDDWELLTRFNLMNLRRKYGQQKALSQQAFTMLRDYQWPGNVRELQGIIELGYCLADNATIEAYHFDTELEGFLDDAKSPRKAQFHDLDDRYLMMLEEGFSFWDVVREPYLDRELNREETRQIIQRGLSDAAGSYKKLLEIFNINESEYLKFMDFLRHHQLKPDRKKMDFSLRKRLI